MTTAERRPGKGARAMGRRPGGSSAPKFVAGARIEFAGTVERHGTRRRENSLEERWLLLTDVDRTDTGQVVAKRVWFRDGKWSRDMRMGHRYAFHARMQHCPDNLESPGISGRINQKWRIANPNKVREVETSQKTKRLDGEDIITFKVHTKRHKKAERKRERANQGQRPTVLDKTEEVEVSQKAKILDGEKSRMFNVPNKPRKKARRKSRSRTIQSIFENRRETGPGRARLWAG